MIQGLNANGSSLQRTENLSVALLKSLQPPTLRHLRNLILDAKLVGFLDNVRISFCPIGIRDAALNILSQNNLIGVIENTALSILPFHNVEGNDRDFTAVNDVL